MQWNNLLTTTVFYSQEKTIAASLQHQAALAELDLLRRFLQNKR